MSAKSIVFVAANGFTLSRHSGQVMFSLNIFFTYFTFFVDELIAVSQIATICHVNRLKSFE